MTPVDPFRLGEITAPDLSQIASASIDLITLLDPQPVQFGPGDVQHCPNHSNPPKEFRMIDTAELKGSLAAAEAEFDTARTMLATLTTEYRAVSEQLARTGARPQATDYPDANAWRDVVDAHRFEIMKARARRRELDVEQPQVAERLAHATAARDAHAAKLTLTHVVRQSGLSKIGCKISWSVC